MQSHTTSTHAPTPTRTQFQGVGYIVRFNWHLYVLALLAVAGLGLVSVWAPAWLANVCVWSMAGIVAGTVVSLGVSWYVYDASELYTLYWLDRVYVRPGAQVVNIHAGFDESSALLAARFPTAHLRVFDFYDPAIHTEVSIKRARNVHMLFPGTESISTAHVPLLPASADVIVLMLSAHEIRQVDERIHFFRQLQQALTPDGQMVVVEHLRDVPNFLAYTIGFLHFHSRRTWLQTFTAAHLHLSHEQKLTPFLSAFFLRKHGTPS